MMFGKHNDKIEYIRNFYNNITDDELKVRLGKAGFEIVEGVAGEVIFDEKDNFPKDVKDARSDRPIKALSSYKINSVIMNGVTYLIKEHSDGVFKIIGMPYADLSEDYLDSLEGKHASNEFILNGENEREVLSLSSFREVNVDSNLGLLATAEDEEWDDDTFYEDLVPFLEFGESGYIIELMRDREGFVYIRKMAN